MPVDRLSIAALKENDKLVSAMLDDFQKKKDSDVAKKAAARAAAKARDKVYE